LGLVAQTTIEGQQALIEALQAFLPAAIPAIILLTLVKILFNAMKPR